MLLILIDTLERMLVWLKAFVPGSAVSRSTDNQFSLQLESRSIQEVKSYFAHLCAGPDNRPPAVLGYVADAATGDLIIGTIDKPATASQKIWQEMSLYCGPQYHVRNVDR